MMPSQKESKVINIIKYIMIIVIATILFIVGYNVIVKLPTQSAVKYDTSKVLDFINWNECITGSDSTNRDCQTCDSLYNKQGLFKY